MLKKEFNRKDVERARNLIQGKTGDSSEIQIGYKKKQVEYKEGDVWVEKKKTWTIKNGIKQNITKLQTVRNIVMMPISCPECNSVMRKRLDKKFWKTNSKCFDCVVNEEHTLRINKEWDSYQKDKITGNVNAFITDLKQRLVDYINNVDNKHFITEAGDMETWEGGYDKKYLKESFDKQIAEFEKKWKDNETVDNK